MIDMYL